MQLIFILLAIAGLIYFSVAKRYFDLFSIAFLSACVYFLPGFFGYALHPDASGRVPVALVDEVYWVMIAVMLAILVAGIYFDQSIKIQVLNVKVRGSKNASLVATVLSLLGFILTAKTTGSILLSANKSEIISELNRWFIVWEIAGSLGAVLSFVQCRWTLFSICILLLLFQVYTGFRSGFAITMIALFLLWLSEQGKQRLIFRNWKVCISGITISLFVFVYKFLYQVIKLGNWEIVAERLQNPEFYFLTVAQSEPFTTQAILNEILRTNFITGMEHLAGIMYHFILFSPELGLQVTSFNDLFQPELFPNLQFRVANNIWAQMWSSGGWLLLIIFIVLFASILFVSSYYLLRIRDPALKGCIALMSCYWAFYIHRNDILYQLNLEKRIIIMWVVCVLISELLFISRSNELPKR